MTKRHLEPVAFGQYNLSVKAVKHDPYGLQADLLGMMEVQGMLAVSLNEAGQADWLPEWAKDNRFRLYQGQGPGASSTPILLPRSIEIVRHKTRVLTSREKVNPKAAGPTWTKTKVLNEVSFVVNKRFVTFASWHKTPSVQFLLNDQVNEEQSRAAARFLAPYKGIVVLGGDKNTTPGHQNDDPLRRIGLVSAQQTAPEPVATKDKRAIDDFDATFDNRLVFRRLTAHPGASDHRRLILQAWIVEGNFQR